MDTSSAIVTALSVGAAAIAGGQKSTYLAVAYGDLKRVIQQKYEIDVRDLEDKPTSEYIRQELSETLSRKIDEDGPGTADLVLLARDILENAQISPGLAKLGVSPDDIEAANAAIQDAASVGTGVHITGASVRGNIQVGGRSVGVEPVDAWPQAGKPLK